jgi:Big-like domain-containing protein
MRRIALFGLLLSIGCTSAEAPSIVASLTVNTNAPQNGVFPADTFQLSITPFDANGDPVSGGIAPVTYSSSNTSVATISSTGTVDALAAGSTKLTGSAGGSHATFTLTVDGNTSGSLVVTPAAPTVSVASHVQLTAGVLTTLGNPARNKTFLWSTADATKATVDANGNVTGVAATSAVSICATVNDGSSVKGCTAVKVQ